MLKIFNTLPRGFREADADGLADLLGGPALIHLPGRRPEPLFLSVLLHGDELTGFQAVQALLRRYANEALPRALSIFVGNVEAARCGARRLEGRQPDYNRVWPGTDRYLDTPEHAMMCQVVDAMAGRNLFASIDIHNNTGLNPHYACVNRIDHRYFHLATLFSRVVVYFTRPRGVQSMAFAPLCPAVTVECGQSGNPRSVAHALEYMEACLKLSHIPAHEIPGRDIDLFHTVATVTVPRDVTIAFDGGDADVVFTKDLDHFNFRELPPGTRLGQVRPGSSAQLRAKDNAGRDVAERFFDYADNAIKLKRPVMPSMLCTDERAVRLDCLCYLMERYDTRGLPKT